MATYAKDSGRVRLNSGNNCQLYFGAAWNSVGNIVSGKLSDMQSEEKVPFADGTSIKLPGEKECDLEIVLAQSSKDEIELPDVIGNGIVQVYYYNGIVDGKHQEIYIPEATIIKKIEMEMGGNQHQKLALKLSAFPQDGVASCTPDDDLPSSAFASGSSPVNGVNQFYVILETAVA